MKALEVWIEAIVGSNHAFGIVWKVSHLISQVWSSFNLLGSVQDTE